MSITHTAVAMTSLFRDVQRVARLDHPEVREIVPSHHCVVRFRQRRPVRARGGAALADALVGVLEDADVSRWPPAWAVSDRHTELWAVSGELAFPLQPSGSPGRFVALTCLGREWGWVLGLRRRRAICLRLWSRAGAFRFASAFAASAFACAGAGVLSWGRGRLSGGVFGFGWVVVGGSCWVRAPGWAIGRPWLPPVRCGSGPGPSWGP